MSIATELEKLSALRREGKITEAEYEAAKGRLLATPQQRSRLGRIWDNGPTLLSWVFLGLIAAGVAYAVFAFDSAADPGTQALGGGAIACIVLILAVQQMFEDAPFATSLMVAGSLGALGLSFAALMIAAPFILIALAVAAAIGAVVTWFGDLFGG
ncbi:MAG: SHOCT domain-containing protein [Pseudomonadota bacterium]